MMEGENAYFGRSPVSLMPPRVHYSFFVRILNRLFNRKEIVNCERDIYLTRWFVVRWKCFAIFIHKFHRSDEDRALHDHPWNFIVIPIWRGYIEHYERTRIAVTAGLAVISGKRRVWPIIGTRYRPAGFRHRVELIRPPDPTQPRGFSRELPSWSIFIRFRRIREWGFWTSTGWVQWNQWWQVNCE